MPLNKPISSLWGRTTRTYCCLAVVGLLLPREAAQSSQLPQGCTATGDHKIVDPETSGPAEHSLNMTLRDDGLLEPNTGGAFSSKKHGFYLKGTAKETVDVKGLLAIWSRQGKSESQNLGMLAEKTHHLRAICTPASPRGAEKPGGVRWDIRGIGHMTYSVNADPAAVVAASVAVTAKIPGIRDELKINHEFVGSDLTEEETTSSLDGQVEAEAGVTAKRARKRQKKAIRAGVSGGLGFHWQKRTRVVPANGITAADTLPIDAHSACLTYCGRATAIEQELGAVNVTANYRNDGSSPSHIVARASLKLRVTIQEDGSWGCGETPDPSITDQPQRQPRTGPPGGPATPPTGTPGGSGTPGDDHPPSPGNGGSTSSSPSSPSSDGEGGSLESAYGIKWDLWRWHYPQPKRTETAIVVPVAGSSVMAASAETADFLAFNPKSTATNADTVVHVRTADSGIVDLTGVATIWPFDHQVGREGSAMTQAVENGMFTIPNGRWYVELSVQGLQPGVANIELSYEGNFPLANTAYSSVEVIDFPLKPSVWLFGAAFAANPQWREVQKTAGYIGYEVHLDVLDPTVSADDISVSFHGATAEFQITRVPTIRQVGDVFAIEFAAIGNGSADIILNDIRPGSSASMVIPLTLQE